MTHDPENPSLDAMERDLEHQRHELADTVNELHDRLDPRVRGREVVAQVQASAGRARARLADPENRTTVVAAAATTGVLLIGLVVMRARRDSGGARRRRRRRRSRW